MPKSGMRWGEKYNIDLDQIVDMARSTSAPSTHIPVTRSTQEAHDITIAWFDAALNDTSLKGVLDPVSGSVLKTLDDHIKRLVSPLPSTIKLYLTYRLKLTEGKQGRYIKARTMSDWMSTLCAVWRRLSDRAIDSVVRRRYDDEVKSIVKTYQLSATPAIRANISLATVHAIHDTIWTHPTWTAMQKLCLSTYVSTVSVTGLRYSSLAQSCPDSRDLRYRDFVIFVHRNAKSELVFFGYITTPFLKGNKNPITIALGPGPTIATSTAAMVLLSYVGQGGCEAEEVEAVTRQVKIGGTQRLIFSPEM
jgi:hypothetical protein